MAHLMLKWRIVVLVALVNGLVFIAAAAILLLNARHAVRMEVIAARDSTADLVRSVMTKGWPDLSPSDGEALALPRQPRHVRIVLPSFTEAAAEVTANLEAGVPGWFLDWIDPQIAPAEIPVPGGPDRILVLAEPRDEASEVWQDVTGLCLLWLIASSTQMLLLTFVTSRTLAPIRRMDDVLRAIERGGFEARCGQIDGPDLAPMAGRIDTLARTLANETAARRAASKELLNLRDSERRRIARDLHDELGPCLFGLTVAVDAIAQVGIPAQRPHVETILAHVGRIREVNRDIIDAIRPQIVDFVGVKDLINDAICDLKVMYPNLSIVCEFAPDVPEGSETVSLTLYRAVREGITNSLRHGKARRIRVRLRRCEYGPVAAILLEVTDDGRGLAPGWAPGGGLAGMRERVDAIGGEVRIAQQEGGGVCLGLLLPVGDP